MEKSVIESITPPHFTNSSASSGEYSVTTSHCLYYPEMGLSISNEIKEWYLKHQGQSPFQCSDWNRFEDPGQYTYFKYTSEKLEKSYQLQGLLEMARNTRYYSDLPAEWIEKLHLLYAPQVYPAHGMQMMICYVGQMAPSARIAINSSFQSANEISRIQTIFENMEMIPHPKNERFTIRHLWEKDSLYQPLRKLIEEALIVYDWGEAFVALNLCIKPMLDELLLHQLSLQALVSGDHLTSSVASAKYQESEWQMAWSVELTQSVLSQNPIFKTQLIEWLLKWSNRTLDALSPLYSLFDYTKINRMQLQNFHNRQLADLNLENEKN